MTSSSHYLISHFFLPPKRLISKIKAIITYYLTCPVGRDCVVQCDRFHSSPNSYTCTGHFDPDKQRNSLLGHGFFTSNSGGHRSLIFPIADCDVNLHNFTGWRRRATRRSCGTYTPSPRCTSSHES